MGGFQHADRYPVQFRMVNLQRITSCDRFQRMYDIKTIESLITELGGDTVLAADLDISQPAVANWKVRGEIPSGWHMRLYARVIAMGKTIDPAVFGLTPQEAAAINRVSRRMPGNESVAAA